MTGYLRNAWYMAAWSHELGREFLTRTILDENIVLFRDAEGTATALVDRCPHRFAPLSRGRLVEDGVQCGYHGLTFDPHGHCIRNALDSKVPRAKIRHFSLCERDHIVWLWAGDPEYPDAKLVPDFSYITDPELKGIYGLSTFRANYELVTDNLMDLSHVEFLHPALGGALLEGGQHTVDVKGNRVYSNWRTQDVPNTVSLEMWYPTHGKHIDHSFDMRWDPPANIYLGVGATLTGRPREEGFTLPSAHLLTPETEASTHYFWHGALAKEHPQSLDDMRKIFTDAFDREDAPMLEAVQRNMDGDFWSLRPIMLATDAGAVRARRVLTKLIEEERERNAASV
ncbi:MAG: aromatic ring-hydroxylating dioxygenase subunit alpha [Myxococcales bacterium]|nr:aromatic ring-hydroxylating dioxygenase subunit alpha [Myxococcales bacterium]